MYILLNKEGTDFRHHWLYNPEMIPFLNDPQPRNDPYPKMINTMKTSEITTSQNYLK